VKLLLLERNEGQRVGNESETSFGAKKDLHTKSTLEPNGMPLSNTLMHLK